MSEIMRFQPNLGVPRRLQQAPAPVEEINYYYAEQRDETHLRDYWKIVLKRSRYIIPVFFGVVAIGALINLLSTPLYKASAVLEIEPQNPTVTGVAEVLPSQVVSGPYDYYQTQFAMLQSQPLAARVIKDLKLESNPSFTGKPEGASLLEMALTWGLQSLRSLQDSMISLLNLDTQETQQPPARTVYEFGVSPALIGRYLSFLDIKPIRNTRLVEVAFSTPDPKLSQDLANEHATSFIRMILENRFSLSEEARDFLSKKLVELREKVQRAENALNLFRQQHGVVSMEKGENIVVDRLVDLNKELTKARAERIESESLHRMVRNRDTQYLAQVLNNPLIQQLKASVANLETEKGRLSSIFKPDHPRIQELNQQIGEARRGLNHEIASVVRGIESNYAAARAREQALDVEAKKQQDTALNLKEVGVDYAVLNEEVTVDRALYENVLKRLNETNVANDLAASNIQITQRAEIPTIPGSPESMRNMILSALLGLLFGVGLAFFMEYMDYTVSSPLDVWKAVSLTTLGVVPHLGSLNKRYYPALSENENAPRSQLMAPRESEKFLSKELVVARNQSSMIAESYRTIRTALLLSQAERPPKVILLTSPCTNDGKTVTALNLGIALAHGGHKVLVIDADLRKGRCHEMVNLQNHIGLTNVLTGHVDLEKTVQRTSVENLYVLPRGVLPPNPADLLLSRKMKEILDSLHPSFQFILIDSPPVIAVSDAAILSALCDGVLLVFNGRKTTTVGARRALERLDAVGASVIGVVLNGVDIRDPDYADYRSYYVSYCSSVEEQQEGEENVRIADRKLDSQNFPQFEKDIRRFDQGAAQFRRTTMAGDQLYAPRRFFDRMIVELSEAFGPAAFTIVREQLGALGESIDAFPKARTGELVQLVSQKILDAKLKTRFRQTMAEEIRDYWSV